MSVGDIQVLLPTAVFSGARSHCFSFNMYVNLCYVLTMICSEVGPVLCLRGKVNCEFSGCICSLLPLP